MTQYALIKTSTSEVKEIVDGDKRFRTGEPPVLNSDKDLHWLTFVKVDPDVDHATQIKTGPVDTITATKATRTWTVKQKTVEELDSEKVERAASIFREFAPILKMLNDGSFIPGSDYTASQIRSKIRAYL